MNCYALVISSTSTFENCTFRGGSVLTTGGATVTFEGCSFLGVTG